MATIYILKLESTLGIFKIACEARPKTLRFSGQNVVFWEFMDFRGSKNKIRK